MTSHDLDALRETLHREARVVDEGPATVRQVSVRARISAIRRRRTATAAALAVVLLGGGIGLVARLDRPDTVQPSTGPRAAGVEVPDRVTWDGFDYTLRRVIGVGVGAAHRAAEVRTDTGAADQPPTSIVTLVASGLGGGTVTVRGAEEQSVLARVGSSIRDGLTADPSASSFPFEAPSPLLSVGYTGDRTAPAVALVEYARSATLPDGVTGQGLVWRRQAGGMRLVEGWIFPPGQSDQTVTWKGDLRQVVVVPTVRYATDVQYTVRIDGENIAAGSDGGSAPDLATSSAFGFPRGLGTHSVRLRVTPTAGGGVKADKAVMALGIYEKGPATTVLGSQIPNVIERHGRTWRLDRVISSSTATASVALPTRPALMGMVWGTSKDNRSGTLAPAAAVARSDRAIFGTTSVMGNVEGAFSLDTLLPAGDTYDVVWPQGATSAAVPIYVPAD